MSYALVGRLADLDTSSLVGLVCLYNLHPDWVWISIDDRVDEIDPVKRNSGCLVMYFTLGLV